MNEQNRIEATADFDAIKSPYAIFNNETHSPIYAPKNKTLQEIEREIYNGHLSTLDSGILSSLGLLQIGNSKQLRDMLTLTGYFADKRKVDKQLFYLCKMCLVNKFVLTSTEYPNLRRYIYSLSDNAVSLKAKLHIQKCSETDFSHMETARIKKTLATNQCLICALNDFGGAEKLLISRENEVSAKSIFGKVITVTPSSAVTESNRTFFIETIRRDNDWLLNTKETLSKYSVITKSGKLYRIVLVLEDENQMHEIISELGKLCNQIFAFTFDRALFSDGFFNSLYDINMNRVVW